MAKAKGRPILGAISGIFLGFFIALALTVYAGVPLDSPLYIVLSAGALVLGLVLGITGPFGRTRRGPPPPTVPQGPRAPSAAA